MFVRQPKLMQTANTSTLTELCGEAKDALIIPNCSLIKSLGALLTELIPITLGGEAASALATATGVVPIPEKQAIPKGQGNTEKVTPTLA